MSDLKTRITEALIARRTTTTSGDPTKLRKHAEADADAVMPIVAELAADLDHAERDNRRLAAEVKRLKGEANT